MTTSIRAFPGTAAPAVDGGLTHEQAVEVHHRFCAQLQALPTVAHEMGIDFEVACAALDGKIWPGVHQHWVNQMG